jgi:Fur family iron response transcriptional regulator
MDVTLSVDLQQRLRSAGIVPTLQRLAVASVLLPRAVHMTAEQVLEAARLRLPGVSRATVYAVVQLLVRHGLLKELPIDGAATVYDSNVRPHHHLYDVDTGRVRDLPDGQLQVLGLGEAAAGLELTGVDVIIRVRGLDRTAPAAG